MDAITMALAELITAKKGRSDALNAVAAVNGVMQKHSSLNMLAGYVEGLGRNGHLSVDDPLLGDFERCVKLTWRDTHDHSFYTYLVVHFETEAKQTTTGGVMTTVRSVVNKTVEFGEPGTFEGQAMIVPAGLKDGEGGAIYASLELTGQAGSDCILFILPNDVDMGTGPVILHSVENLPYHTRSGDDE